MKNKYLNLETGEILSKKEINKNNNKHSVDLYVGIESKFPSECKTEEQLIQSLSSLDAYLNNRVVVNVSAILLMVTSGCITVKEATLLSFLCEEVVGWNYYIGRIKDMNHITSNSKNLGTMLKGLEERGLIKILHKGFCHKDSVVIQVNPFYTWKGDIKLKDASITNWYSYKSSKI